MWVVDPLDGTKEFINHIPEFCVCIALVDDGVPVLGVSYNPAREEMFAASQGAGATLNGAPAHVSAVSDMAAARFLASRSENARGEWDEFKSTLRIELTGSVAYKLGLIAAGKGDATFSLTPKNEWDICAGTALITEAGGRITNRYGRAAALQPAARHALARHHRQQRQPLRPHRRVAAPARPHAVLRAEQVPYTSVRAVLS